MIPTVFDASIKLQQYPTLEKWESTRSIRDEWRPTFKIMMIKQRTFVRSETKNKHIHVSSIPNPSSSVKLFLHLRKISEVDRNSRIGGTK
jgi:hypothetical protein